MTTVDRHLNGRHLESVFHAIQDGIVVMDPNLTVVAVNRWMETHFTSRMPLVGKKCHSIFWDREHPCEECLHAGSLEASRFYTRLLPYPSSESPTKWFEISIFPLEDAEGKPTGAAAHVKDITQRRQAEELLQDEVAQRRMLVEQSRDGIVVLDSTGKVYEANRHYADMLGYTLEEVHRLHVWDWDTQWPKEQLLEMLHTVDDSGDHFETRHQRKDGSCCDVEISTNGTVYRGEKLIFCICRDVTGRKKAEKEREQLIKSLRKALKEIKTLRGILPLCSFCKKIRDDQGYWEQVDIYLDKHSQADISHSICPECVEKFYPDLDGE